MCFFVTFTLHQLFIIIESDYVLLRAGWQRRILFSQYHYILFQINYVFTILLFYSKHGVDPQTQSQSGYSTLHLFKNSFLLGLHPEIGYCPRFRSSGPKQIGQWLQSLSIFSILDLVSLDSGPLLSPETHHRAKLSALWVNYIYIYLIFILSLLLSMYILQF